MLLTIFTCHASELREIFLQVGHLGVRSLSFSPDAKLMISGNGYTINLWNLNDGALIRTFTGRSSNVCVSPDGRHIASGSSDFTIKLWNIEDGALVRTFKGHVDCTSPVCFSPDGRYIASGSSGNTINLWNVKDGTLIRTFKGHSERVMSYVQVKSLSFSLDGRCIASVSSLNKTINLWNVKNGELIRSFKGHSASVNSVSFSPDGRHIASGSFDYTIKLWNVKNGALIRTFYEQQAVNSVCFSTNGRCIASGLYNHTINLWNVKNGTLIRTFEGDSMCFSPNGRHIASGGSEIKLWNVKDGALIRSFSKVNSYSSINSVGFSPNGRHIASGDKDTTELYDTIKKKYTIKLWNVKNGSLIRTFKGHTDDVNALIFSPDGRYIASGSSYKIKLWNVKDGALIRTFVIRTIGGDQDSLSSLSFSPDGTKIASGDWDQTIKLWNVKDGALIRIFEGHSKYVNTICFSPDGKSIASGSDDETVKLWNVKNGGIIRTFKGHSYSISSLCFSPDGRRIASGSRDCTIKLWNIKKGDLITTFKGHSHRVVSVSFSPDGRRIASGSYDNTIKLWDVKDGTIIRTFKGHTDSLIAVSFTPDGKSIASGSSDNTLRIWNINNENDSYIYTTLPDNEWISYKSGQPYYNASPKGDKYAAIRFNNDTFNYEPLINYREQYKTTNIFQSTPISKEKFLFPPITNIGEVQLKLLCTFEGKQTDAYDIDEDIKVFSNCSNKTIPFTYNEHYQFFTGSPGCPIFNVHTNKFKPQSSYPSKQQSIIKMKFNKPVLYVLINPSLDLKIGPFNRYDLNFDKMKDQLRILSSILDNNQKYRFWSDRWFRTYFYTKHAGYEPVLLSNAGIFSTKWDDPDFINSYNREIDFKNQNIPYRQLINAACNFFNGFSISDDLSLKGAALIIIGSPQSPISKRELFRLDQQLHQYKYCVLIVQFGENKKNFTFKGKLKKLKIMEMNLEKEFYNVFFKSAFEKIITEFESLIEENSYASN